MIYYDYRAIYAGNNFLLTDEVRVGRAWTDSDMNVQVMDLWFISHKNPEIIKVTYLLVP